ncbi:MAG: penicillin-binding protein activator [bacterium]|nr:penicillin-binding protein activator [bacterium]
MKIARLFLIGLLLLSMSVASFAQSDDPIRVGVILPLTGAAAAVGPEVQLGVEFAFGQIENEIAGRPIEIIFEDETDDPAQSVARARKLVEEDGVDVIIGPQLAHTGAAVSAYAEQAGVIHIALGAADGPESAHTFFPGSGRGDAYQTGVFAYEELGARTAAVLYADYLFGQQSRDGFVESFTELGGEVTSEQPVGFGVADMAPFLENIGDVDVVAVLLLNPSDFAFVRQYREFGLEAPVIFISNAPQEAPLLTQMGDDVIGMYGSSWYSPLIDSEENAAFVGAFVEAYERPPGTAVHVAYSAASMFIAAAEATEGDTSPEAITEAILALEELPNPSGVVTMGEGRVAIHPHYIFQVEEMEEGLYVWAPVTTYEAVEPR